MSGECAVHVTVQPPPVVRVTVAAQQGPAGPPGVSIPGTGDANYRHEQAIAAAVWDITHNLEKYPSVTVIDSAGTWCEGALEYLGINALRLTFAAPFGGVAYLN